MKSFHSLGIGGSPEHFRILAVERRLAALEARPCESLATVEEKLRRGSPLTRSEVAAYLGVSTRKVQRMEPKQLARCPNLGTVVRYAARDVLRLASAS
jgi:hypothetical protein